MVRISAAFGQFAGHAKSILDSAYDVTVECLAIARLGTLNDTALGRVLGMQKTGTLDANADSYLKAINVLSARLETAQQRMKALDAMPAPALSP